MVPPLKTSSFLANIGIVLVDTRTPANIGAVARSMMNMGLARLVLVRPPADRNGEARKLAAGADGILARAAIFGNLAEAVADQQLVIGVSRQSGRLRKNVRTPREAAGLFVPLLPKNAVSLVFGNEVNGLEKSDLALCHEFIAIPSSDAFPSLNLSHAVMIAAYEFFLASAGPAPADARELADHRDLERFYSHLRETLSEIGFFGEEPPERMMFSLRQLFARARPDTRDVKILHGILSAMDRKAGGKDRP